MVILKNIEINSKTASADFFPEISEIFGHIVVDLDTREISEIQHVPGYEFMHPAHARQQLIKMAENNDTRKECTVMWY